jgi:hypothetical protein
MKEMITFAQSPIFQAALVLVLFIELSALLSSLWGAPWAPTSLRKAQKMLEMASVKPDEKLVDLGAGDGRIVIIAARSFQAQAFGVEIDPLRCLFANLLIRLLRLHDRAHIYYGDMNTFDLRDADVVSMYLLQSTNQRIKARLAEQLRPGTRVVSHTFTFTGWSPVAIDGKRRLFLYEIGNTGPDVIPELV